MVRKLDKGLSNFAEVIKKELGRDVKKIKGSGAAGGLGAGLTVFLNANLRPGIDIIIEATQLEDKIKDADLVITGEGALDKQTFFGKSVLGVVKLAKKYNIPIIIINGSVLIKREEIEKNYQALTDGNFSIINKSMKLKEAVETTEELLGSITRELFTFYLSIIKNNYKKRS